MADDVLIPEAGKKVIIKDQEFVIGEFTVAQVLKITKFLGGSISRAFAGKGDFKDKSNAEIFFSIFEKLDEQETIKLLAALLKTDDLEFVQSIPAEQATEVIAIYAENNDIQRIWSNVQRVIAAVGKKA